MSFLRTPGDDEVGGRVRETYDADPKQHGDGLEETRHVAPATAARSVFCRTPDAARERLDAPLRETPTVGRPIAQEVSR